MSNYKGLFTYDVDNHRYIQVEQAEGIIDFMNYQPEPKQSALRVMVLTLTNFIENEPTGNVDLEDCKQMLEKLKAWERLKDNGFRFTGLTPNRKYIKYNPDEIISKYGICYDKAIQFENDLDLLFGGKE